jgi:protein SCO1/2
MNPRVLIRSIALMLITLTGIMIFWFVAKPKPTQFPTAPTLLDDDNPYASLYLPPFTLTDSNGNTIDESILDGKYTVVDFFYTSCPLICPGMSAAMREVQNETADTDLQLLSISIDPEIDTPEIIKRYAEAFKADPDRWRFTTGNMEMITILLMGMNFDLGELNSDDGFRNIDHPATLILLGPDRHVIKLYRYADPDQLAELIETARELTG